MSSSSARLSLTLALVFAVACQPERHETSFTVPRGGLRQFLDIPWPSDIDLREDGTLDLQSFPNPTGSTTLEDYLALVGQSEGYSTNGVIYLGAGAALDASTLPADPESSRQAGSSLQLVDVDASSPAYGQRYPVRLKLFEEGDLFVPTGGVGVWPELGYVLAPRTSYAVVMSVEVSTDDGAVLAAPPDLVACLAEEVPEDSALRRPHEIFAPLRRLWEEEEREVDQIALATVFTTMDPTSALSRVADDVIARNSATIDRLVEAEDYDDYTAFHTYEGELTLDQFQAGTPPFNSYGTGDFHYDSQGNPAVQRRETMPFALTVPRGPVPAQGWPIALVAHGTGGWWRGFVGDRAGDESTFLARAGYAALGISQPLHRGREGYQEGMEEIVTFNFFNPVSGRTNWMQSALETIMLSRFLRDGRLPIGAGARRIPVDGGRTAFFGHSQGGLTGTIALGLDRDVKHAVLSGAGGGFAASFVGKEEPVSILGVLRLFLGLPEDHEIDHFHPVLAMIQLLGEPVEPLNYARLVYRRHGIDAPSILLTSGWIDTYTPVVNHAPLGAVLGIPPIDPLIELPDVYRLMGSAAMAPPVSANINTPAGRRTGGLAQFHALGGDGHFVVFQNPAATSTVQRFLNSCRLGGCEIDPRP